MAEYPVFSQASPQPFEKERLKTGCTSRSRLSRMPVVSGARSLRNVRRHYTCMSDFILQWFPILFGFGVLAAFGWVITIGKDEPTELRASKLMTHGIVATLAGGAMILGWCVWRQIAGKGSSSSRGSSQSGVSAPIRC